MARGYLFEISRNMDALGNLSEESIVETDFAFCEADYYNELNKDEIHTCVEDFLERFAHLGCTTGSEDDHGKSIPYIVFSDEAKKNYFRNKYVEFLKATEDMSLHDFATDSSLAYCLSHYINDSYSDAVMWDSSFYTLDAFVRSTETGTKYYIGNILLMH